MDSNTPYTITSAIPSLQTNDIKANNVWPPGKVFLLPFFSINYCFLFYLDSYFVIKTKRCQLEDGMPTLLPTYTTTPRP